MNWIKVKKNTYLSLKEGAICRTEDGNFVFAGEINTGTGINDEMREKITHYTEHFVDDIKRYIERAEMDFNECMIFDKINQDQAPPSKVIKVQITQEPEKESSWYRGKVGEIFLISKMYRHHYYLHEDVESNRSKGWRFINEGDFKIIEQ